MMWMRNKSIVLALSLATVSGVPPAFPNSAESAQDISQGATKAPAAIEAITVRGEGDAAELVIKLTVPTTYTSYRTTSPLRLVIDLSQSTQGAITAPVVLNRGNFKTVTVSRYDTDAGMLTRLDVELVRDADAVLSVSKENPGEIRVAFPALVSQPAPAGSPADAVADMPVSTNASVSEKTVVTPDSSEPLPPVQAAVSRSLSAVSVKDNAIVLAINGGAGEFKTFRLNKPDRFAVDLFDVKSLLASRMIPVNAFGISSVRLGLYPDKVRVVFDAVDGNLPEIAAVKTPEGVTVSPKRDLSGVAQEAVPVAEVKSKGETETPTQAEPAAQASAVSDVVVAPPAAPPEVQGGEAKSTARTVATTVEMIDFQVVNGLSRVAVKVGGEAVVEPPVKSPGFVTLTIGKATLPKRLQRSLEAKGFSSPVLRVTPLLVKTRKGTDTKIRIAMRKSVPYEYRQEGDMLFIDFKNPEDMTVDQSASGPQGIRPKTDRGANNLAANDAAFRSELVAHAESSPKPFGSPRGYKGRKVTLEFADAEVRKIFQLLSEVSNKNFVLGDDVTGTISIKLVNVPWDQALDIILDTKGLDKREDGNIVIIKGKGKFKSQAEEDLEIKKQQYRAMELKSETFNVNYADIAGIVSQFTAIKSERGVITPDARTNKVIVRDIPLALDDMRKLLTQLDIPEKQVMIEARIVEASSTFTRSLGVNWGIHYTDASGSFLGITQLDTGFGGITTAPPTSGTGTTSGGNMGISFGALGSGVKLDMRLSAAATAGLAKIISSPKVATLNNKTAKIAQGQQIPYTSSTSDKSETKFVEAALALEVTPHINANGTISLKIDAKNDSMGDAVPGADAPAINKKQATTEMLLKDGETTVIGGIFVDSDSDSDAGVPFLMDIPFIGKFFKTSSKSKTKTELLVFITPRILG
jgi:type IV pilus assembly protein PilQ